MKRFALSVLTVSMVFVGLGSVLEHVGAKFKSDEKALDIVRKARTALGGEAALAEVRSLVISGRSVHTMKIGDAERQEAGETEIALQFPDKLSQRVKIGSGGDEAHAKMISEHHDILISKHGDAQKVRVSGSGEGTFTTSDGKTIVLKEKAGDGTFTTDDGKKVIVRTIETSDAEAGAHAVALKMKEGEKPSGEKRVFARSAAGGVRQNELLKLSLSLLLTAPAGMDVSYTFAGESDIDGTAVNVINAEFAGSSYKLFIGKSNNLPVAISYRGMSAPKVIKFTKGGDAPAGDAARDHVVFTKELAAGGEQVEHIVKFSDYRSTGSVQLPYKWTTTVAGTVKETFDVTSYDVNPANIAERFAEQKVFVRSKKADGQ